MYLKLDYKEINVNDVSVSVKTYIHWRSFLEDNCMEEEYFEASLLRKVVENFNNFNLKYDVVGSS